MSSDISFAIGAVPRTGQNERRDLREPRGSSPKSHQIHNLRNVNVCGITEWEDRLLIERPHYLRLRHREFAVVRLSNPQVIRGIAAHDSKKQTAIGKVIWFEIRVVLSLGQNLPSMKTRKVRSEVWIRWYSDLLEVLAGMIDASFQGDPDGAGDIS